MLHRTSPAAVDTHPCLSFNKTKNNNKKDFLATRRSAGAAPILLVVKVPQHFLDSSGSVGKSGFYFADHYQKQRNGCFCSQSKVAAGCSGAPAAACASAVSVPGAAPAQVPQQSWGGGCVLCSHITHTERKQLLYSCQTCGDRQEPLKSLENCSGICFIPEF